MAHAVLEPELDAADRATFAKGVALFNAGHFFECHDTLEELWAGIRGPGRDFLQGLIQVAVAFYHLGGGNLAGAESLLTRALKRFEGYPAAYFGFDLAAHRAELGAWLERIRAGGLTDVTIETLPKWRFDARGP